MKVWKYPSPYQLLIGGEWYDTGVVRRDVWRDGKIVEEWTTYAANVGSFSDYTSQRTAEETNNKFIAYHLARNPEKVRRRGTK